jgi:seryl-tRNA synthetase
MSENNQPFDIFDPTGMLKTMRNEGMDAWAKMMIEVVNTDAYAEATGTMMDAWLSSSAPFRQAIEKSMTQALGNLNMPTRAEITTLAERLTNIEMRLDDLDAKLDETLTSTRKTKKKSSGSED